MLSAKLSTSVGICRIYFCTPKEALAKILESLDLADKLRIRKQLPGVYHPDFIGLDSELNDIKGGIFEPRFNGQRLTPSTANVQDTNSESFMVDRVQKLGLIPVVLEIVHSPEVSDIFKRSNKRIFAALIGIDNLFKEELKTCDDQRKQSLMRATPSEGWAAGYKKWIGELLDSRGKSIVEFVSDSIENKVETERDGKKNLVGSLVDGLTSAYPTSAMTFDANSLLDWTNPSTITIRERPPKTEGPPYPWEWIW
ncbi:MAG: hypothetical protein Q9227_008644 [Pyrenula ochraceoflavens]